MLLKCVNHLSFLKPRPDVTATSVSTLKFKNGSRIISLPATENTVRGYSAHLVVEDEAGDVDDRLHVALLPMLIATRGRLILAGTPKGRRGHFFEHWERSTTWEHHFIPWSMCPRIPAEEIQAQRTILRDLFAQEYEGSFLQGGGGMVYGAFDSLRNTIDELPACTRGQTWQYMLGMDFGFSDHTALVVVATRREDPNVYVVHSEKHTGKSPGQIGSLVKGIQGQQEFAHSIGARVTSLESRYSFSRIVGDTGGLGGAFAEELRRRFRLPIEPAKKTDKPGYIRLLNGDLQSGQVKIVKGTNQDLISEMTSLPWNSDRSKEAPGFDNHLCDALLYVWRSSTTYLQRAPQPRTVLSVEERHRMEVEAFWEREERAIMAAKRVRDTDPNKWLYQ